MGERQASCLTGMWEKNDVWLADWRECYYTGRQRMEQNPYRLESEPYVLFGFLAKLRFGPLRLFLNAENL